MSHKRNAEEAVRSVVRNEIDDAVRAIKTGDLKKALSELDYAERKLKSAADEIHRIKEA